MRDIKFRAWNDGEMILNIGLTPPSDGLTPYKVPDDSNGYEDMTYYPEAILMQYTGLKDKNGVEIYEGDIIRDRFVSQPGFGQIGFASSFDREWCTEVRIPDIYMHWDEYQFPNFETLINHFAEGDNSYGVEVIGNIYENPDLLK